MAEDSTEPRAVNAQYLTSREKLGDCTNESKV
jgi:hypothetical protein